MEATKMSNEWIKRNHFRELHCLTEYCRKVTEDLLYNYRISYNAYIILNFVHDLPETTQYEIVKNTLFSTQRVNQLVNSLYKEGMIHRNERDMKLKKLSITRLGTATVAEIESKLIHHFKALGITEKQMNDVANSLRIINFQIKLGSKLENQ